jgi:lipopolysaccharide/colanic/teichoic acid biosynthesis glycosyltransferase
MTLLPQRLAAFFMLLLLSPVIAILYVIVKVDSKGPFVFQQKRVGKKKEIFTIYKIRTMVVDAEKIKGKYLKLNEGTGPIFKIYNDPRHTRVGRIVAHLFLDELLQLVNVIKGEMAFVGPRPLLISDVKEIPKKYNARFDVLPGLTSLWTVKGRFKLSFAEWMELDVIYAKNKSLLLDLKILFLTILLLLKTFITALTDPVRYK